MATTDLTEALFDKVNRKVQQYMQHPFLRACQIRQTVSRFHFDAAWAILQAARVSPAESQPVLEALLLLQQGLCIHDTIDEHSGLQRQLTVLAGDYDSSRYYWILARSDHQDLLPALCEAVVQINEAKATLYLDPQPPSSERSLECQVIIEGALLFALAAHYGLSSEGTRRQLHELVKAYVLREEIQKFRTPKWFSFRQAHDWLSDAFERFAHLPASALVEPLSSFLLDYLSGMKRWLEKQTFAEGNR